MKAHEHFLAVTSVAAALVFGATWTYPAQAEEGLAFHVVGYLKLPATKAPNDFHHLHVSETNRQRFVTVSDSDHMMTIIDATDRTHPTLARQVRLPDAVANGDPVIMIGGVTLVTEGAGKTETPDVRTVSIVRMNRQTDCWVTDRFENVTGLEVDATQSHIYLVSGDGLWILGSHVQRAISK